MSASCFYVLPPVPLLLDLEPDAFVLLARPHSIPINPCGLDWTGLDGQLVEGTMAVETSVLRYMKDHRLYGFGRQSQLERMVMAVSDRFASAFSVERRWLTLAGIVAAVGVVAVTSRVRRTGGCPVR